MDYSKVKFVKPSAHADCHIAGRYLTKGKVYPFINTSFDFGNITDNEGKWCKIRINDCFHLKGKNWIPCDENGKELDSD